MQTRLGRHGTALTGDGKLQVKAARHGDEDSPIDDAAAAPCAPGTRGATSATCSPSASRPRPRLVSLHNVAWTLALMARMRAAIAAGTFAALAPTCWPCGGDRAASGDPPVGFPAASDDRSS